jgi:hypothetical protein
LQYSRSIQAKKIELLRGVVERGPEGRAASGLDYTQLDGVVSGSHSIWIRANEPPRENMSHRDPGGIHERGIRLACTVGPVLLIGIMAAVHFLLLAFAVSASSDAWLKFAIPFYLLSCCCRCGAGSALHG